MIENSSDIRRTVNGLAGIGAFEAYQGWKTGDGFDFDRIHGVNGLIGALVTGEQIHHYFTGELEPLNLSKLEDNGPPKHGGTEREKNEQGEKTGSGSDDSGPSNGRVNDATVRDGNDTSSTSVA